MAHIPVLLNEVIKVLDPEPGELIVDGTLGDAGHSTEIIKKISPDGTLLGLDLDSDAIDSSRETLRKAIDANGLDVRALLVESNFAELASVLKEESLGKIDGLLLDLGFSSDQVFAGKGFSYRQDEPLVMRYDSDVSAFTAARLLNEYDEKTLSDIISKYGEERFADRIANGIVKGRREESLRSTSQLVDIIKDSIPGNYQSDKHPAKRTFQAIRIFVNNELESLKTVLNEMPIFTKPGARIAVISFHSLEDRIVKEKFNELVDQGRAEIVEELVRPDKKEKRRNPRSRSAKLRCIEILKP